MYLTINKMSECVVTANCQILHTHRQKLDEVEADSTLAHSFLAGLRKLDKGVTFGKHLNPVRHFHDVRACHAVIEFRMSMFAQTTVASTYCFR